MRRLLPDAGLCALFAMVAVICAALAVDHPHPEYLLAGLSMPVFIAAALLGMRKNRALVRQDAQVREEDR